MSGTLREAWLWLKLRAVSHRVQGVHLSVSTEGRRASSGSSPAHGTCGMSLCGFWHKHKPGGSESFWTRLGGFIAPDGGVKPPLPQPELHQSGAVVGLESRAPKGHSIWRSAFPESTASSCS